MVGLEPTTYRLTAGRSTIELQTNTILSKWGEWESNSRHTAYKAAALDPWATTPYEIRFGIDIRLIVLFLLYICYTLSTGKKMHQKGFEPIENRIWAGPVCQLRHWCIQSEWQVSNLQPHDPKSRTLPIAPHPDTVPMSGFEPPTSAIWRQFVCQLRHMDITVPRMGVEPINNHRVLSSAALPICVPRHIYFKWAKKDLNLQKPKPTVLQTVPLPITGYSPKSRQDESRTHNVYHEGHSFTDCLLQPFAYLPLIIFSSHIIIAWHISHLLYIS